MREALAWPAPPQFALSAKPPVQAFNLLRNLDEAWERDREPKIAEEEDSDLEERNWDKELAKMKLETERLKQLIAQDTWRGQLRLKLGLAQKLTDEDVFGPSPEPPPPVPLVDEDLPETGELSDHQWALVQQYVDARREVLGMLEGVSKPPDWRPELEPDRITHQAIQIYKAGRSAVRLLALAALLRWRQDDPLWWTGLQAAASLARSMATPSVGMALLVACAGSSYILRTLEYVLVRGGLRERDMQSLLQSLDELTDDRWLPQTFLGERAFMLDRMAGDERVEERDEPLFKLDPHDPWWGKLPVVRTWGDADLLRGMAMIVDASRQPAPLRALTLGQLSLKFERRGYPYSCTAMTRIAIAFDAQALRARVMKLGLLVVRALRRGEGGIIPETVRPQDTLVDLPLQIESGSDNITVFSRAGEIYGPGGKYQMLPARQIKSFTLAIPRSAAMPQ